MSCDGVRVFSFAANRKPGGPSHVERRPPGPSRARAAAAGAWRRLPGPVQELLVDAAASAHAALVWAWLALLALLTVRWDPTGSARRPIPVLAGRAGVLGAVHLVAAATPLQLRLAAYFWRNRRHEPTLRNLRALLVCYGGDPAAPVDVSGTVAFEPPPSGARPRTIIPLSFRLKIDLAAGTFALIHQRGGAEEETGEVVCEHAPARAAMGDASMEAALAPLIGRRLCPALAGPPAKA